MKRPRPLLTILILTWLLAAVLAGGLITANSTGVFTLPASPALPPTPTGTPLLPNLAPTWTLRPNVEKPGPETPVPAAPQPEDGPSIFEPTRIQSASFPPTPTFILTEPSFMEGPLTIGLSAGGRPIELYRFGNGAVHRMIVAGIHGGYEWNTTALADQLIAYFQEHPDAIPRTVTLFIVRTLNPDGYARDSGINGRVNDNGVDLNRNFPVNWVADWDRSRCWNYAPTTGGSSPASEPETQALIEFITNNTRVTALISYHSAALGIFPGGDPPHPASVTLAEEIARVSTYPYPPIDIGCVYSGTLADWAASEGIAAVDMELHSHALTDFDENLAVLMMFLAWRR